MGDPAIENQVLEAARMVATQGLGEGRPAHGFVIIVGDANEILANALRDPHRPAVMRCKYGDFLDSLHRRSGDLKIGDCLGERKQDFLSLFHVDGAIVVDGKTGQVCCGGFFVHNLSPCIVTGGGRTRAASAMATQANGCYVVLASEASCGSVQRPIPPNAVLDVFDRVRYPRAIPVRQSESMREPDFREWLRPIQFGAELRPYNVDFVEGTRQWVLDDIEAWRCNSDGSPCRVLLAGPGFGKTAIAARLYKVMTRVLAIHLCRHSDTLRRDPRRMITSIASQLADALPQFREALLKVRKLEGSTTDAYSLRSTARELADCLLFTPLNDIEPPERVVQGGRDVIIIDALDEAEHDSMNSLLSLVALDFRKLPPWVAVLVTARPDADIRVRLAPLHPTVLDAEAYKEECNADVRAYLHRILARRFKCESSLIKAIDTIATKSEGLFLYLHHVRNMLAASDDIDALPRGLPIVYQQELERVLGPAGLGDENSQTRRVIEAIIAAQVPVHVMEELPSLSGVAHDMVLRLVSRLSRLLFVRDKFRVYMFHKSFINWLTGDGVDRDYTKPEFIIDRRAAHRRLASSCGAPLMRMLSKERDRFESDERAVNALQQIVTANGCAVDDSPPSLAFCEYALKWSITHLVEAGGLKDASLALFHSLGFLIKRAPQIDTLITDAILLLPETTLLRRALVLAQNHVRLCGAQWLSEELWQRLLRPAEASCIVDLKRLARDAHLKARADLMFSSEDAYFKPADSALQCLLEGHSMCVNGVTSFADAKSHTWLASCSDDGGIRIWDPINGGEAVHVLVGHTNSVSGVTAFVDAKDRAWVASCSHDKTVHIWDTINGGEAVHVLEGHSDVVKGVTAFVDAKGQTWLASCSYDKTVRIWDPVNGGEAVHVLEGHSSRVNGVTTFVDTKGHRWVASCSHDKTIRIWDPITGGTAVHVLEGHSGRVNGVTAFMDANSHTRVASCSGDKTVRIWDPIKGGEAIHVLEGHSESVNGVATFVGKKGDKWVASCSDDNTVRIWNPIEGGQAVHVLKGHSKSVNDVIAFVDGNGSTRVASCSEDTTVRIWDPIGGGEAVRVLDGHCGDVKGVTAFVDAEGNSCVASYSTDRTVCIWDPIRIGEAVREFGGHSHMVARMSMFGGVEGHEWLLSCEADNTVRICNTVVGREGVYVLRGHSQRVSHVTTFMDAKGHTWVVSGSEDRTVRIWDPFQSEGTAVFIIPLETRPISVVVYHTGFLEKTGTVRHIETDDIDIVPIARNGC